MDEHAKLIEAIEQEVRATARWTGRDHLTPRVMRAMRTVRREAFVPRNRRGDAYANHPLPIGHGQTISQPFIVALMTDLLDPQPDHVVLEVGTGSGYQAAVLAALVKQVYSIEVIPELSVRASEALVREGVRNVSLHVGNGSFGWPEHAPYDGIIVTAATPDIPAALITQLRPGGRMVVPLGDPQENQTLTVMTKDKLGAVTACETLPVAFVPLTGR